MDKWKVKVIIEGVTATDAGQAEALVRKHLERWNVHSDWAIYVVADDEPMDKEE